MATFTKRLLSESVNGKPIKVVATATAGTLIHTAVSGTSGLDEVWLYAYNGSTSIVVLTIEFGGADVPDQNIVTSLSPKSGLIPIVPGLLLQNGLTIRAFAGSANLVTINGFVNRIE